MQTDFDVLIVGGGLVGASLACALRAAPLRVAVIEAVAPPLAERPGYDDRTLALAYGSRRIFEGMGLWQEIAQASSAAPIERIHISDRGRFGVTRLQAQDAGLPALGYVVSAPVLGSVLHRALAGQSRVTSMVPAVVGSVAVEPSAARVRVQVGGVEHTLNARLVVAADGANSPVRTAAGIAAEQIDYAQSAVVTAVTPERPHRYTAYERFTESGPLAVLPASKDHCAVVWTIAAERVDAALGWDDDTFRERLQEHFGERLGRFVNVGRRRAYPLALTRVRAPVRPRLIVIGNAAHTVHPVAGQGFNLGLRDVAALAEVLCEAAAAGADVGATEALQRYAEWRAQDTRRVTAFTHFLARVFSNDFLPVVLARDLGLVTVDLLPCVKSPLIRLTSGQAGRLPRLARGLPLRGTA